MRRELQLRLDDRSIFALVGGGLLKNLHNNLRSVAPDRPYYFIIDSLIFEKYAPYFQEILNDKDVGLVVTPGGKSNKTFASAMRIFADLEQKNVARDCVLVAVGGGVVGDLAGFVASCWYRGVDLIHIPTTFLSSVDSSLGGKTALNFRNTVNAIGTYHHPIGIFVDTSLLLELPAREIASGFGEVIKYAVLGSDQILSLLESPEPITEEKLSRLVALSLNEKAKYVNGDLRESSQRLFLNFGHTIGHAIELATVFNGREMLQHGEGVALGMLAILRVCVNLGLITESDVTRVRTLLTEYGLPTQFSAKAIGQDRSTLVKEITERVFTDKKRTKRGLRLVVLRGWGSPEIFTTSDSDLIRDGVEEVIC